MLDQFSANYLVPSFLRADLFECQAGDQLFEAQMVSFSVDLMNSAAISVSSSGVLPGRVEVRMRKTSRQVPS